MMSTPEPEIVTVSTVEEDDGDFTITFIMTFPPPEDPE
jgi:hypothetical protein